jgi:hypothetical protein
MDYYEAIVNAINELEELRRGKTVVVHPSHYTLAADMVQKANVERERYGWEPWDVVGNPHVPKDQALIFRGNKLEGM